MSALISPEYLEQLQLMRSEKEPHWGNGGTRHADEVLKLAATYKVKTVLDYGCGHGALMGALAAHPKAALELHGYDPGMSQFAAEPAPADMVISTDVLEHIEPALLDNVLAHIRSLTKVVAYLAVHTGPARAILPDGRNAHLIQQPGDWWQQQLLRHFKTAEPLLATDGARKGYDRFGPIRPVFVCE